METHAYLKAKPHVCGIKNMERTWKGVTMEPSKLTKEELAREIVETRAQLASIYDEIDGMLNQINAKQVEYRKVTKYLRELTEKYFSDLGWTKIPSA
jgi:hypothetical protein